MYVIVAYHPHRPPAVYGPIQDRHPPTAPAPAHSAIVRVPLHPATTRLGTPPANPAAPPHGWPRTVHTSRRLANAITTASPPPENATPVVLLVASPTSGLLTAIGPFTTTGDATSWLNEAGRPGGDITATAFPLQSLPNRLLWTVPDRRDRRGATAGRHENPATALQTSHHIPGAHRHQPAQSHQTAYDDRALIDHEPTGKGR